MAASLSHAVIFGGGGFIGLYFAKHLLENKLIDKVVLCDLSEPQCMPLYEKIKATAIGEKIDFKVCDVRERISINIKGNVSLIGNFAAVHREPGHEASEYYETNIKGAENVCEWAEKSDCNKIIFTSSIAPYGVGEHIKNEETLPVPSTPYGCSKLVAEKIHEGWLKQDKKSRYLTIIRPGVVFGAYEGGNVTRMIRAVKGGYFFFAGNENIKKSSIYVRELCYAICWVLEKQVVESRSFVLFNAVMPSSPTLKEYVDSIRAVMGDKKTFNIRIPYVVLFLGVLVLELALKPFRFKHPFSTVRLKKLTRSNHINPDFLKDNGYKFRYMLVDAFKEWKVDKPNDWS